MHHAKRKRCIHLPKLFKRLLTVEEKIKNTVSLYTKIPVEEIAEQTVIDRSAVASSILLHRMYANLAAEGIIVENYFSIKTYGQLLASFNGKTGIDLPKDPPFVNSVSNKPPSANGIGIDVEEVSSMPVVNDYREDEFYKMNFAPSEIAYCILQPDPAASFAGLFAAKEAIVKADNQYKSKPFHSINIDHLPGGKPVHLPFELSISHTGSLAIAVAVRLHHSLPLLGSTNPDNSSQAHHKKNPLLVLIAVSAFFLALLAVLLILFKASLNGTAFH